MKPLHLRLHLLSMLLCSLYIAMGVTLYFDYNSFNSLAGELKSQVMARHLIDEIQRKEKDLSKELQDFRSTINDNSRKNLFSDIIQSYNSNNKNLLQRRIQNFNKFEKEYSLVIYQKQDHTNRKIYFHFTLLSLLIFGTIFSLLFFVKSQILGPIQKTTKRIRDFLNGKYSYYFGTPPENEVGELQATFNSMAQEVLKNMEELKALDSAKSDFLNIASHELRTPMTSIKGSLSLLTSGIMGEIKPEVMNLMKIAETETDRLVRLINDILDMAKIDAKKLPLNKKWIDLNQLLHFTKESLQGLSSTFGIPITIHEIGDIKIYADSDRIQQVLMNLLSNAIKFSPQGQSVEIFVGQTQNQHLKIMVKDHGKGMTPQEKSILFQKFRQITSPDNPLVKGTGLGLAIAKALVEEHRGEIGVDSIPNEGSTFYFTLPDWSANNNIERVAA